MTLSNKVSNLIPSWIFSNKLPKELISKTLPISFSSSVLSTAAVSHFLFVIHSWTIDSLRLQSLQSLRSGHDPDFSLQIDKHEINVMVPVDTRDVIFVVVHVVWSDLFTVKDENLSDNFLQFSAVIVDSVTNSTGFTIDADQIGALLWRGCLDNQLVLTQGDQVDGFQRGPRENHQIIADDLQMPDTGTGNLRQWNHLDFVKSGHVDRHNTVVEPQQDQTAIVGPGFMILVMSSHWMVCCLSLWNVCSFHSFNTYVTSFLESKLSMSPPPCWCSSTVQSQFPSRVNSNSFTCGSWIFSSDFTLPVWMESVIFWEWICSFLFMSYTCMVESLMKYRFLESGLILNVDVKSYFSFMESKLLSALANDFSNFFMLAKSEFSTCLGPVMANLDCSDQLIQMAVRLDGRDVTVQSWQELLFLRFQIPENQHFFQPTRQQIVRIVGEAQGGDLVNVPLQQSAGTVLLLDQMNDTCVLLESLETEKVVALLTEARISDSNSNLSSDSDSASAFENLTMFLVWALWDNLPVTAMIWLSTELNFITLSTGSFSYNLNSLTTTLVVLSFQFIINTFPFVKNTHNKFGSVASWLNPDSPSSNDMLFVELNLMDLIHCLVVRK
ncbi:hypothetical protein WICPIJ_009970 [Wickerhamomyces pijperi]|uniref:Uncharacterized protein n=1 Tax=Wickerhamomyces pijperi TaxID=599730 RepID=A0A9P8TBG0_WICPI|nr:hypothetical protein WICPIJ_009970 [Wickerhamomyces pijperi]